MPSDVKKRFGDYKQLLIGRVGRGPMDDLTIDKIGKAAFGKRWAGVFASDTAGSLLRTRGPAFAVVNTATSRGRGSHWLGLYIAASTGKSGPGHVYLYDSFGREPQQASWRLNRAAAAEHIALSTTDPAAEQRGFSAVCGQLSLSWLLTVRDFGIKPVAAVI